MITITESHVERARKLGACRYGLVEVQEMVGRPASELPPEYLIWWAAETEERLPADLESVLLERGTGWNLYNYVLDVIGDRWPELESVLLERGSGVDLYRYAHDVIGDRWPEAEDALIERGSEWEMLHYAHYIAKDPDFWESKAV